MKSTIAVALLALAVAACSTAPKQQPITPSAQQAVDALPSSTAAEKAVVASLAELAETNGTIKLTFDDAGNWISIVAVGSADVVGGGVS